MKTDQKRKTRVPKIDPVKFIQRSNGTIKGYSVNTYHGLVKNYNEDRVSIIMNITKPNFKGRWPRCSYFGVFDGHGGNSCSDFLKERMHKYITQNAHFPQQPIDALKYGFKKAEQQFLQFAQSQNPRQRSGSCAIVILMIDQMCYIANVGDSRAILSANSGKNVYAISKDHKPDSDTEKERIYNAGGKIYQSTIKNKNGKIVHGPYRIEPGKLSVSRSFGDFDAKLRKYDGNPKVLIAKPEITYFQINSQEHDFVMVCSDGVYDKLENEEVSKCFWEIKDRIDDKEKYQFIGKVPSEVIERSMEKMSMDNLTSLVIVFEDHGKLLLPSKKETPKRIPESNYYRVYASNNENQNQNNQRFQPKVIQNPGKSDLRENKSSRIQQNRQNIWTNRQLQQENRDHNRQNRDHSEQNRRSALEPYQKMVKRKSTTNIHSNINQKRGQNLHNGTYSLNNSISAKMLAGTKAYHKKVKESGQDKININDLVQKKKSVDMFKKQKDSLWKQMYQKRGEQRQKVIRF